MKKVLYVLAGVFSLACSPAHAAVDPLADFFDGVFGQEANLHPHNINWRKHRGRHQWIMQQPVGGSVNDIISEHVASRIGSEWVPTALKIAHIESGGRCGAVNRSGATGVFQVMHPERFGVSRAAARTCEGGIAAGVAHMQLCISKGARTPAQLMRCHNSGSPFGRVERAYRRFVS